MVLLDLAALLGDVKRKKEMNKLNYDPNDPYIRTFTKKEFHFLRFKPEDICIEDIAHALSNICRYTGHCKQFYSVAEHSIMCCDKAPNSIKMWSLLHDAAEAYISNLSSPFKSLLSFTYCPHKNWEEKLSEYENLILQAVSRKFGLSWPIPEEVHEIDKEMLREEMEFLWSDKPIKTLIPKDVEKMFLSYFWELVKGQNITCGSIWEGKGF
jgi:hypothetical protein